MCKTWYNSHCITTYCNWWWLQATNCSTHSGKSQAAAMSQQLGVADHVVLSLSLVLHFHLLLYAFVAHHWPQVLHRTNGTKRCHQSPSVNLYAYCTHSTLCPPFCQLDLATRMGGAYNWIMIISLQQSHIAHRNLQESPDPSLPVCDTDNRLRLSLLWSLFGSVFMFNCYLINYAVVSNQFRILLVVFCTWYKKHYIPPHPCIPGKRGGLTMIFSSPWHLFSP